MEVFILADQDEAVLASMVPNRNIGSAEQTNIADVGRTGIAIGKRLDKASRQVFIEQELRWRLSQRWCSRPGAHARPRKPSRRECRRPSAAENRQEFQARSCRRQDRTERRRP